MTDYCTRAERLGKSPHWILDALSLVAILVIMLGGIAIVDKVTTGVTENGNYNVHVSK